VRARTVDATPADVGHELHVGKVKRVDEDEGRGAGHRARRDARGEPEGNPTGVGRRRWMIASRVSGGVAHAGGALPQRREELAEVVAEAKAQRLRGEVGDELRQEAAPQAQHALGCDDAAHRVSQDAARVSCHHQ
jgi:hypothetical protein